MPTGPIITPIDYTSRDYDSLRESLISAVRTRIPSWSADDPTDFGLALLESFAYVGDVMSYYIDRAANEAFLSTAVQRESVVDIARTLGYYPSTGTSARVKAKIYNSGQYRASVPRGTQFITSVNTGVGMETLTFEVGGSSVLTIPPTKDWPISEFEVVSNVPAAYLSGNLLGNANNVAEMIFSIGDKVRITGVSSTVVNNELVVSTGSEYYPDTNITKLVFQTISGLAAFTKAAVSGASLAATNEFTLIEGATTAYKKIGTSNGGPSQEFTFSTPSLAEESTIVYSGLITGFTVNVNPPINTADPLYGIAAKGTPQWQGPAHRYTRAPSSTNLNENSKVFFLEPSYGSTSKPSSGKTYTVRFGDGSNGYIPPKDSIIYVTYTSGGGTRGNIGAGVTLRGPGTLTAVTTSGGFGGSDKESLASIKKNASGLVKSRGRAVTLSDFSDLAKTNISIGKALARSSSSSAVTVYVAPTPTPSGDIAPGYIAYRIKQRSRNGSNQATLIVSDTLTGYNTGDTFRGYVSGVESGFDTGVTEVEFTVGTRTAGSTTTPVTYSSTGSVVSLANCSGVITIGVSETFTRTMSNAQSYIQKSCNYGTTVTVSPVIYKDLYIDVTIFVADGESQSRAVDTALTLIKDLYSFENAEIGDKARSTTLASTLNNATNIDSVDINMFRATSDTVTTTTVSAGTSGILRLLIGDRIATKDGTDYYNTFSYGNLIIRIGANADIEEINDVV
jgi:hypothetical protein